MGNCKFTILVVDDCTSIRQTIKWVLTSAGYNVVLAEQGFEALRILREQPVDLLLVDETMPGMTGQQLCAHVRSDGSLCELPVVFLTSKAFELSGRELLESISASALISKPFSSYTLLGTLEDILAQQLSLPA